MKFQELKKSLANGEQKQIYLIVGEDAYLRENAYTILKNAYLTQPDLNLNLFNGQDVLNDVETFLTAVQSYPFMSEKRFVVVRDFYPKAQDLKNKILKKAFTERVETTILIIINAEGNENLNKLEGIEIVDCSKLDLDTISLFVRNKTKKHGLIVQNDVIETLANFCSRDMFKIDTETDKLIAYSNGEGEITMQAVEAVVGKDVEYQAYELAEYIAIGNVDKAYETLKSMIAKNDDKQKLFNSIYYHFRRLFYTLISGASDNELAESLSTKWYVIKNARQQAKKFTPKRLKNIVDKLSYYDTSFKSGKIALTDALFNSILNIIMGE